MSEINEELKNEVVVTIGAEDDHIPFESLGINIETSPNNILDAVRGIIQEQRSLDITDNDGEYSYTVRKALNSNTIYVYPKSVAGK